MSGEVREAMSYDAKCYELAADFLADEPSIDNEARRIQLAQTIQDTIEQFLEMELEEQQRWERR